MAQSTDIRRLAQLIKSGKKKLIVMMGAGSSTSSGIPDFRSPGTGLYHNLMAYDLEHPEDIFDIDFFRKNPKPFYLLSREIYPGQHLPTKFHFLIRLFQEKGLLQRVYTQNIDTLERVAGIEDEYVVEAHGSFVRNHCIKCGEGYSNELFKEKIFQKEDPKCLKCSGLVKPDIVFFGEGLPELFFDRWEEDGVSLEESEDGGYITITAGTSLTVYPFASLPAEVPSKHLRVLVNLERVGDFKANPRKSDLLFLGSTDGFAESLVKQLGWEDELKELIEQAKKELEEEEEVIKETTKEILQEASAELGSEDEETKEIIKQIAKEIEDHTEVDQLVSNLESLELKNKDKSSSEETLVKSA